MEIHSLATIVVTIVLSGCVVAPPGTDNSFGARASRGVMAIMAHEMCPYGVKTSQTEVGSQIHISSDSSAYYREDAVQVLEEYRGHRSDECLPPPTMKPYESSRKR